MSTELDVLLHGKIFKRFIDNLYEPIRKKYDLKQIEVETMAFLDKEKGSTSGDIFRKLRFNKGHISQTVDSLCSRGLIDQRRDPKDRRSSSLYVSRNGEQIISDISDLRERARRQLFEGVTPEELEVVMVTLDKIIGNMERMVVKPGARSKESETSDE